MAAFFNRLIKKHAWATVVVIGFLFVQAVGAASYYVSVNGSDSNPGTQALPWRSIQKAANNMVAGDTVLVGPGDYKEEVTTKAHGSSNARIRYLANPPNVPTSQVITKQFRVQHRFNVIEGFNLTGAQNLNNATIRVEFNPPTVDGSHTIITNNTVRDGVYLMSDDLAFDHTVNGISTLKENWLARGFEPGGYVFLGSNSKDPYTNHDTAWRIRNVTTRTLYLTNNANLAFQPESHSNVWGVVYAGNGNNAFQGVDLVLGPGISGATNCTIVGNTFSNIFGCPIKLTGENHLVEGNKITRIHGYYGIQPHGRNQVIRKNLFIDCTNFLFFTQNEVMNIPHPAGANYFDYQVAFLSSFMTYSTNILFENNWLQNIHNQLGLVSQGEGTYGFTMRSNVFVGVQTHLSGSRSGLRIENNTFYRCAFDEGRSLVLGLGGINGVSQRDLVISRNAFIDCGSHYSLDYEGFYGITDSAAPLLDYNFVCGAETMGFAGKRYFAEANGVNGGDPVLRDPSNPLGPDGLPFTSDDGLRPLANSPLVRQGIGALSPLPPGVPDAHFRVVSPTGWFDAVGTNFNPGWTLKQPYERGDVIRPYRTPESLGVAPVTVSLSASNSIAGSSAQSMDTSGIVAYIWSFGDNRQTTGATTSVQHTYTAPGTYNISLTISNSLGGVATSERQFRVLMPEGDRPPAPSHLRVLQSK